MVSFALVIVNPAGNLHLWFDEGEGLTSTKLPPYSTVFVVAFRLIEDASVIQRILRHLGLDMSNLC